jgi:hypothetical protein
MGEVGQGAEEGCAKLVAPAYHSRSLGSNPDIPQRSLMGDVSQGVANTLYGPKKFFKIYIKKIDGKSPNTVDSTCMLRV